MDHIILYNYLQKVKVMLQGMIHIHIRWNKVDSHIENRIYKEGKKPARDDFLIQLNNVVDIQVGEAREGGEGVDLVVRNSQVFYEESQVMVQLKESRLLYSDITKGGEGVDR